MKSNIWLATRNNPDGMAMEYLEKFYKDSKAKYVCG